MLASVVFCHMQVINEKLAGPDFVWFLPNWLPDNWWATKDNNDCIAKEMIKALEHSLGGTGNNIFNDEPFRILVSNKVDCDYKAHLLFN